MSVPEWHKIGSLGSSWLRRFLSGHDDRLQLVSDSLRNSKSMLFGRAFAERSTSGEISASVNRSEGEAFIFLHGFNVTFEEAALRTAQLGCDLAIPGVTAFYSWPSRGEVAGYTADEATIEASERYIAEFLEGFLERSGAKRVNLFAHGLGNRGLLRHSTTER